eukprot:COSAG01_NODE_2664_length_7291_cov_4.395996_5_plen_167_part_00
MPGATAVLHPAVTALMCCARSTRVQGIAGALAALLQLGGFEHGIVYLAIEIDEDCRRIVRRGIDHRAHHSACAASSSTVPPPDDADRAGSGGEATPQVTLKHIPPSGNVLDLLDLYPTFDKKTAKSVGLAKGNVGTDDDPKQLVNAHEVRSYLEVRRGACHDPTDR